MSYQLTYSERLRGRKTIDALFAEGRGGFVHPFRYVFRADPAPDTPTAVLFSVPKKNHKRAHVRNLLKRRTREAYRLNKGAQGLQIALVYSSKAVEEYAAIEQAVKKILVQIAGHA